MLILHEDMPSEARGVAEAVEKAYGIPSTIIAKHLDNVFIPIEKFHGYFPFSFSMLRFCESMAKGKYTMILTPRDLYAGDESQDDDWVLGGTCSGKSNGIDSHVGIVSGARMKREDSKPSSNLTVPLEKYSKRLQTTAVHEIGHDVVRSPHLVEAKLVNSRSGHELELGKHCTDNKCLMYEVIDIKTPKPEDSYLLLGNEKRFDAGLDEAIARMYPDFFCKRCRDSLVIDDKYGGRR
jgi:predicted Zn-dependent protease